MAKPFLKWAGGKTQLLPEILAALPTKFDRYFEPFIGGGAVFFAIAAESRFVRATIADINPHLVEVYTQVRDNVEGLICALQLHAALCHEEAYYYEVRARAPDTAVERAARFIFLNKTCFNGLYRVNRKGGFNVPFGKYANPNVCDKETLRAASAALARTEILVSDFESVACEATRGDVVYFDPPYVPLSPTSSFAAYNPTVFGKPDHTRLAATYRACAAAGVVAVLSNSDTELTRSLYHGLDMRTVNASRAINSVGAKRGKITEILVCEQSAPNSEVAA